MSSVELFAEVRSLKTHRRQPAVTASAFGVTVDDTKKKSCRKPCRNARRICSPEPSRKHTSFSEFDDYELYVETCGANDYKNRQTRVPPEPSAENCISSCSTTGEPQVIPADSTKKLCTDDSSFEILSQAVEQLGGRCAGGSGHSEKQCDMISSRSPLVTSTPQPLSVMSLTEYNELVKGLPGLQSEEVYNQLVNYTSQLQLFDDGGTAEMSMCSCLVVAQYRVNAHLENLEKLGNSKLVRESQ